MSRDPTIGTVTKETNGSECKQATHRTPKATCEAGHLDDRAVSGELNSGVFEHDGGPTHHRLVISSYGHGRQEVTSRGTSQATKAARAVDREHRRTCVRQRENTLMMLDPLQGRRLFTFVLVDVAHELVM
jgi:hypothetical protein